MENIDELVELDRLNMAPVIEQAGGKFNSEVRRRNLLLEMEKGAVFFSIQRSGKTIAYFQYMPEPNDSTNEVSLRLHRKLGFMKIEEEADRVLFVTDGKTLCERLARFNLNS